LNIRKGRIKVKTMRFDRPISLFLAAWTLLFALKSTAAQQPTAPESRDALALYGQLNEVAVDPSQVYFIRGARINRGGINLYFDRGFIGFFTPVAGRITGATFLGEGEVLLIPPDPAEKRSLAQFTKSAVLEERFTSAYLRFTDGTARELLQEARRPEPGDPEQPANFAERWNTGLRALNVHYSVRILEDLLGRADMPFFQARVAGSRLGEFVVTDDERIPEAIQVTSLAQARGQTYDDVWCSFPSPTSRPRWDSVSVGSARIVSYKIETHIAEDNSLDGRAVLELESRSNEDEILPFELSPRLRVVDVEDEDGHKLVVFPEAASEDPATSERKGEWIAVALPSPYPVGSKFHLTFTYQGNVITDVGNGVLYVGSRGSWYPNRGGITRASFDLTFRFPERLTLVATGSRVEEGVADGWKHSRWVSDSDLSFAGFNLGAYQSREQKSDKVLIEVYATKEAEAALQKRYLSAHPPVVILAIPTMEGAKPAKLIPVAPPPPLDPAKLLDEVLSKASESVQYFSGLFGPFPYSSLALAQVPGDFGQGWPGLVYLPTLSFLPGTQLQQISGHPEGQDLDASLYIAHEIAHQWWGNEVSWKSYHDQWLSEGFATYAAALTLAREKDGDRKFHDLLQGYKHDLLSKNPDGETVESGGPIWLGQRLSSSVNPTGYDDIVYKKSCWVLHMLRSLMTDPKTGSDKRFFDALRAFVKAYTGRSPSTEDFLAQMDRYMTPSMDLDHNHHMEWFFADWVYGTGIPEYKLDSKTRRLAGDAYVVEGEISQSGVPGGFEMLVPVLADAGRGRSILLGRVAVSSTGGKFRFTTRFKPSRVAIDDEDLLAIVK
jgi:Peptidase family M1 domain